jgi:hypothetical protein
MKGYTRNDVGLYIDQLSNYPLHLMGGFNYKITSKGHDWRYKTFCFHSRFEKAEKNVEAGRSQLSKVVEVESDNYEFDNWAYRATELKVLGSTDDFNFSPLKYTEHIWAKGKDDNTDELQYVYGVDGNLLSYGGELLDKHGHLYTFEIKWEYDKNGNVISRTCKYDDESEHPSESLEYDDRQRIVKMIIDGREHYGWGYDDLGVYKMSYSNIGFDSITEREKV